MRYRVEIAFTLEADWLGEAAEKVQLLVGQERGLPRHFALSIRPLDQEGNPGHGIGRVMAQRIEARETAAYQRGREEHEAYVEKMEEIARLMDIRPEVAAGTPEGERLRELAAAVEEYEQTNYPIGKPTDADVEAFELERKR